MNFSKTLFGILILSGIISCVTSCKPKEDDNPSPSTLVEKGKLMFHLHTYVDEFTEVDGYNIIYTRDDGRKISVSMAQLYISDIQLVKLDGSRYNVSGTKLLKELDTETYLIGEVPAGNYKSVRFSVGLDAATNKQIPTTLSDDILNSPDMWMGSIAQPDGYVFLNFQGKVDTTSDASGANAEMQSFEYRIGTNAHYQSVSMPDKNFTIVPNQTEYAHVLINYSKLFNGVQLNQSGNLSVMTKADNSSALADKISSNIASMFVYE